MKLFNTFLTMFIYIYFHQPIDRYHFLDPKSHKWNCGWLVIYFHMRKSQFALVALPLIRCRWLWNDAVKMRLLQMLLLPMMVKSSKWYYWVNQREIKKKALTTFEQFPFMYLLNYVFYILLEVFKCMIIKATQTNKRIRKSQSSNSATEWEG